MAKKPKLLYSAANRSDSMF